MTQRFLIGGPSNSGKSTFILSVTQALRMSGVPAKAVELDVWSNSYPAFRGEVTFEGRPKRFDAHQDDLWWREALAPRIEDYLAEDADIVFGDLPGVLGAANSWTCEQVHRGTDAAIVVAKDVRGIKDWSRFFKSDFNLPIRSVCLSSAVHVDHLLPNTHRQIDPSNPLIQRFGRSLVEDDTT